MKSENRRQFFKRGLKGLAVAGLALLPGSFFSKSLSFAGDLEEGATQRAETAKQETLESFVKRKKKDFYQELNAAKLTPEEKVAAVAVQEVPRAEIQKAIAAMQNPGSISFAPSVDTGFICGSGCGTNCGAFCGARCAVPIGNQAVIDPAGRLNVNIKALNKSNVRIALQRLMTSIPEAR
jgi:hypothetical protein